MKVTSSYAVEIKKQRMFDDTIKLYREAVSFLIGCFNKEWLTIQSVDKAKAKFNRASLLLFCMSQICLMALTPMISMPSSITCTMRRDVQQRRTAITATLVQSPMTRIGTSTNTAAHRLVGGSFIAAKADAEQYCICYNKVIKVVRTTS